MALESPRYEVERTIGSVEIRHYEPYLVASTTVRGSLEGAGNTGFGILARYIFGANDFTSDSLPTPDDDRVSIEEVASQRLAALGYRGRWSKDLHDRHLRELRETLGREGLTTAGGPIWARYDPPWKPWFLRHNEVLLALVD